MSVFNTICMRDLDSDKSKLIVLYLEMYGESTVEELKDKLSIKLIELYSVLSLLVNQNYIEKTEKKTYRVV